MKNVIRGLMALIVLALYSCDDGGTKTSIWTSSQDGTVSRETLIHDFTFPRQVLDLADVRIEYMDDEDKIHSVNVNTVHYALPTLTYTVVFGKPRADYGGVKVYFDAKPNIDEILKSGDYSQFLRDENTKFKSEGTSKHEDGVFGGSFSDTDSFQPRSEGYSNEEIKKMLTRDVAIYTFNMQWEKAEGRWIWKHQTGFNLYIE